jgi:hypothetical protein
VLCCQSGVCLILEEGGVVGGGGRRVEGVWREGGGSGGALGGVEVREWPAGESARLAEYQYKMPYEVCITYIQ